jgi:hypothetical protein
MEPPEKEALVAVTSLEYEEDEDSMSVGPEVILQTVD